MPSPSSPTPLHDSQGRIDPEGDLRLLDSDTARRLRSSTIPARLTYVATDDGPRVMPTWFGWAGEEIGMATYPAVPAAGIRHPAARIAVQPTAERLRDPLGGVQEVVS